MSFRRRITLVSATAVAVAVLLASVLTYLLTSHQLRGQVDSQLRERALTLRYVSDPAFGGRPTFGNLSEREIGKALRGVAIHKNLLEIGASQRSELRRLLLPKGSHVAKGKLSLSPISGDLSEPNPLGKLPARPNQVRGYQQLIDATGKVLFRSPSAQVTLPIEARTRQLAAKGGKPFFSDAHVNGIHLRILAEPLASKKVVQFAQPLTDVDHLLRHLRLILALLDIGGIALAAVLGRLIAGAAVTPVKRLTQATEHVAQTQDLSKRITSETDDEIGRLAISFNAMMDALERSMTALDASVHAQRQLVADASHELRTPVTSLRTNIEILQQVPDMDSSERQRLLGDVVQQIEELTMLMNDLIDLARGEQPRTDIEDVRLDLLVSEAVERAQRHTPRTAFDVQMQDTVVWGIPARLDRAINNLIDNAVKYSPADHPVQIRLHENELTVRDFGPGISKEDLPNVFDRFYRGAEARSRPGSGLGLAIVRQVAKQHGGAVSAEGAPGGGTMMRLRLPASQTSL
jgi:two-component system, OmpR family, sensor histidine kinase MprB